MTWSADCVIIYTNVENQNPTFEITETKFYYSVATLSIQDNTKLLQLPVVTLSTQDNTKLLQQVKSGFKRTINWNKYLSKPELLAQNPNLNHLVEASFQGINRLFFSI